MKRKITTEVEKAIALLNKNGYDVAQRIGFGSIVWSRDDGHLILISQHDPKDPDTQWAGTSLTNPSYCELLWIDHDTWRKGDGSYEVVGSVDLGKWLNSQKGKDAKP